MGISDVQGEISNLRQALLETTAAISAVHSVKNNTLPAGRNQMTSQWHGATANRFLARTDETLSQLSQLGVDLEQATVQLEREISTKEALLQIKLEKAELQARLA